MADKDFNWWEVLGAGVGTTVGAGLGTLVGNPVGGAALGYGIGTSISPGGYWNENQTDPQTLAQPESAGITAAAIKEMEAARSMMRQEIGVGVQGIRQQYGQAGTFQSGARGRAESAYRQQGLQSLSGAFAGIELEAIRARQSGAASTMALQMQEAQFAWQKRQMENQMISTLVQTALPFFMKDQPQDPDLSLDPSQNWGQLGFDPFIMETGGGQSPWRRLEGAEAQRALAMAEGR